MSGIKTEKSKKFQPININNSYQPIINKSNKSSTIRHVGLQPLGKIGVNRRVPAQSLQQKEPLTQLEENGLASMTDSNSSSATNNDDQQQQQSIKQSPPLTPSQTPNSPKDDNNQEKCNKDQHHQQQKQCLSEQPQLSALDAHLQSAHLSQQDVPQRMASPLAAHPVAQAPVHPIHSHPLPATQSSVSHNSHRNTPPRLAAAAKPILTDKELENLDDITRQTKWASGKITIDYDAKLNFSDDEEDQPQQEEQPLHAPQELSQVAQERRLNREGDLNDYDHNRRRDHRDRRDRRDRPRSPPPPRHRNHLPPLDSRPLRNSHPSHQLSERAKQPDRGRPHPDHLQQNQQNLISQPAGALKQQTNPQPPPEASVRESEEREESQEKQDNRPQPVLNGGVGDGSSGSSVSEGKGVANKKTMSAPQVAPPRRDGPHPSRHSNNYNSHHRNIHQNHYQQNHGNNNMGHPQHNNHGQHQPQQRLHNQHQQRPTPMARMNQTEMQQPLNHVPIQHDKHSSGSPGMVMNVMSHSKAHHRLGAPSPAEQLAQSTAKLQINLGNPANSPPSGNNNPNNHHHSHHNSIIDNGLNNNNNNNNINSSNHHNSHRAPTAPRFMREHHNHRNNSPSFSGDQQRHYQQPMRNQQLNHSPQLAGRQQAQQAKPRQSSPSQRQSPPALATALEAKQASGPALTKDQSSPQQHQNPKPAEPTAEPQSRQTPPPSAPNLNQQQQQQAQEQSHQSQQHKQQPSQPARQAQNSRERDPPRQQESDSQSNKYRPVISRVFYRSDIKRVSGSRQGDYK